MNKMLGNFSKNIMVEKNLKQKYDLEMKSYGKQLVMFLTKADKYFSGTTW